MGAVFLTPYPRSMIVTKVTIPVGAATIFEFITPGKKKLGLFYGVDQPPAVIENLDPAVPIVRIIPFAPCTFTIVFRDFDNENDIWSCMEFDCVATADT